MQKAYAGCHLIKWELFNKIYETAQQCWMLLSSTHQLPALVINSLSGYQSLNKVIFLLDLHFSCFLMHCLFIVMIIINFSFCPISGGEIAIAAVWPEFNRAETSECHTWAEKNGTRQEHTGTISRWQQVQNPAEACKENAVCKSSRNSL